MKLTEENVLNHDVLELTYQWEAMQYPDRVQVWFDRDVNVYRVKFDAQPPVSFIHFGAVVSWLGNDMAEALANSEEWL